MTIPQFDSRLHKYNLRESRDGVSLFIGDEPPDDGLSLGLLDENGQPGPMVWFTGEGSLVTVAPPGAGKGQAHIVPNLLLYDGPAIVLDIKGENYDLTHEWRQDNVGPVFKFAPFESDSDCYNPLDYIRTDNEDSLWDDARLTAGMLMVTPKDAQFWDIRAKDVLTAILALTKRSDSPELQNMQMVLDYLYPDEDFLTAFIQEMKKSPFKPLERTGNILSRMPEKQMEGIFDSARQHVDIWQSGRVARVTEKSDWIPADFWKPPWKTLYISIPVGMVAAYASVIRSILGQHIQGLIESAMPSKERKAAGIPPVLFLIDEMPQLGFMEPIPYAIEVGRSYGLRLWMFAQSEGQITTTYPDGKGLMEMCYAQCFMNPEFKTARELSQRVGYKSAIFESGNVAQVLPQDLMQEAWIDRILLLSRGRKPGKLIKQMAYQSPKLRERMGNWKTSGA